MNCDICDEPAQRDTPVCDRCQKIMDKVIREVGPDLWGKLDDCKYIYPMVKRVAEGTLRTQDIVNEILKGEN